MPTVLQQSASEIATPCAACGEPVPADAWACPACGKAVLAETGLPAKGAPAADRPAKGRRRHRSSSQGGPKTRPANQSRDLGRRTVRVRMTPATAAGAALGLVGALIVAFLLGMMVGRS